MNHVFKQQTKGIPLNFRIEYYLPFYPLLWPYKVGPLTMGTIGLLVCALFTLGRNGYIFRIPKPMKLFIPFFSWAFIRDVIRIFLGTDPIQPQINRIIEYLVVIALTIIVCMDDLEEDKLFKSWKIAGIIYSVGLIYHLVQIYVFGHSVSTISIIPGYVIRQQLYFRPLSFFAEPASFVIAMMPLEFMSLRRRNYFWAVLSTLAVLASTSTVGVILTIALWIYTLLCSDLPRKKKFSIIVIAIAIIFIFFTNEFFTKSIDKFFDVMEGGSTVGSRISSGLEVIRTMPFFSWIFGTNYNEVNNYIITNSRLFDSSGSALLYLQHGNVFLNTVTNLIFSYGIVGLSLYVRPFIRFLKTKGYKAKAYVVMIFVSIFGQGFILGGPYFMMVIICVLYAKQKNENNGLCRLEEL